MEVVRKIMTAGMLSPIIDLPWASQNTKVEVLVLPISQPSHESNSFRSMKGRLKEYANPELAKLEKSAWANNVEEKYGNIRH
ncbi:MAG: hypothetical protein LBR49_05260 [Tannerella sp.]|jgi:hypothetical protein|nr:hypothetical protein [Tannerella sp.]